MTIDEFLPRFAKNLFATDKVLRLERAAQEIAVFFAVTAHEVAYFQIDSSGRSATFRWPPQSRSAAPLPLKAFATSLVSTTVRREQGFIDNAFAGSLHLHMYEHLLADPEQRLPIQKIMSVPLYRELNLQGVIQVCRKGHDPLSAGEDFIADDLQHLQQIVDTLAHFEL